MAPDVKERTLKPAKEGQSNKTPQNRKKQAGGRISAACEACKKRKTKCTGGPPPCQLCQSLKTECVIDLSLDMRRRAALQRTMDESKNFQDTLNGLVELLRDGRSPECRNIVSLIEGGALLQDIINAVHHNIQIRRPDGPSTSIVNGDDDDKILRDQSNEDLPLSQMHTTENNLSFLSDSQPHESRTVEDQQLAGLLQRLKISEDREGLRMLRSLVKSQHSSIVSPRSGTGTPTLGNAVSDLEQYVEEQSRRKRPKNEFGRRGSEDSIPSQQGYSSVPSSTPSDGIHRLPRINTSTIQAGIRTPTTPQSAHFAGGHTVPQQLGVTIAQDVGYGRQVVPPHLVMPMVVQDDSPLSRVYTDFLNGGRQMLAEGVPLRDVIGIDDSVDVTLIFRSRRPQDKFDTCSWASELYRSFTQIDQFARLANVMMLTFMMRWQLVPTAEYYERLPDMMKPTPTQRMVPHIGAIELITIPIVRDAAITYPRDWLLALVNVSWSVSWPYSIDEAVERHPTNGNMRLTQRFMEHASNYENWSAGSSLISLFPELAGKIRIHD